MNINTRKYILQSSDLGCKNALELFSSLIFNQGICQNPSTMNNATNRPQSSLNFSKNLGNGNRIANIYRAVKHLRTTCTKLFQVRSYFAIRKYLLTLFADGFGGKSCSRSGCKFFLNFHFRIQLHEPIGLIGRFGASAQN